MRRQEGQALVIVLVVMLVIQVFAFAFLSRMNGEQRLAGGSARSTAAFYAAEAGLQKALWILEEAGPEAFSNGEGPLPHRETLGSGTFTIEELEHLPSGLISIVARGEAAGEVRRVKALVRAGPEALAYGIYGQRIVAFDGQSRTYVLPCRASEGGCRRGGDLAGGGEIWFNSRRVALNAFTGARLPLRDGDVTDTGLLSPAARDNPTLATVDLVLAGRGEVWDGIDLRQATLEDLQRQVRGFGVRRLRSRGPLLVPPIDAGYLRAAAETNTANAAINASAGFFGGEMQLQDKSHSRYTEAEFEAVLDYLRDQPVRSLQGIIVVDGDVTIPERMRLTIADGALLVNGNIELKPGARLMVRHSDATRVLPGIVAWGEGTLQIRKAATVVVDGLILAGGDVQVDGGLLDVIGAVVTGRFLNNDGTAVILYDSSVLAAVGLRAIGKGIVDLLSWQELP